MASVYNLIGAASTFPNEIIRENVRLEQPTKKRYFAVLTIQRCYRGYRARVMIKMWHKAATIIQKVVRGWIVRWHRVDYLREYLERVQERDLNMNATKIQAYWRGYKVRKEMRIPIKELIAIKTMVGRQSSAMRDIIREKFRALNEGKGKPLSVDVDRTELGEECKRWVLFILFKTHHLLRTQCREGIYSVHGSNHLSQVERWMKTLPMKKYMNDLRRMYRNNYTDEQVIEYLVTDKKLRRMEYLYKTRDKSHEFREKVEIDKSIHEKPFDLYKRPKVKPYERLILNRDKYSRVNTTLLRSFSQFSSDFDLFVHKPGEPPKEPPPYYIDFWDTKCTVKHACRQKGENYSLWLQSTINKG